MKELTRRRDPNLPNECWRIYYSDVHVGTISARTDGASHEHRWDWNCGFYPGTEPRPSKGLALSSRLLGRLCLPPYRNGFPDLAR
jgi:hypothetical protein